MLKSCVKVCEIPHPVGVEQSEPRPFPAEVPPHPRCRHPECYSQYRPHDAQVYAPVECQYPRIALQFAAEGVERLQAALYLRHVGRIVFKLGHHHGVVDVCDAHLLLSQHLAEEHVLVAAALEALVEGAGLKHLALYHEVCRAKLAVGVLLPLLSGVCRLRGFLVEVAQVVAQAVVVGDGDAAVHHALVAVGHIALQEPPVGDGDVAVEKQQPVVSAVAAEIVAGGRAAGVLLLTV